MTPRDLQLLLRGVSMVAHEALRLELPEAAIRLARARAHAADLLAKLPLAAPTILAAAARGTACGTGSSAAVPPLQQQEASAMAPPHEWEPAPPAAEGPRASPPASPSLPLHAAGFPLAPLGSIPPVLHAVGTVAPPQLSTASLPPPPPHAAVSPPPLHAALPLLHTPQLSPLPSTAAPLTARPAREFRERRVPSSQLGRVWGFGSIAARMLAGSASDMLRGVAASAPAPGAEGAAFNLTPAQAERLADGLARMRGAALKIGQMLSISDEHMLTPAVAKALERVRASADIMPRWQLERVLATELGSEWRTLLGGEGFREVPVAAASIGQVHRATLADGTAVAVKVQYPGVADSINSDLDNLRALLTWANFLPKGLYLDPLIDVAREELATECNYTNEAAMQMRFRELCAGDADFEVPSVLPHLSTRRVLTTTWLEGVSIDRVIEMGLPQEVRDRIARALLKLTLKELFVWRFMQVRGVGVCVSGVGSAWEARVRGAAQRAAS